MVEFTILLSHKPVVLFFTSIVNKIGNNEGRGDGQNGTAYSPQGVGDSVGNGASKGLLLHGRKVVLGGSSHLNKYKCIN